MFQGTLIIKKSTIIGGKEHIKLERFSGVAVDVCGVLGMRRCVGRVVGGCWCEVYVVVGWWF